MQIQHPCRKIVDPRFFSHVTKISEVLEFFCICSRISLNVTQKISKCLNGRIKCLSHVPVKKLWPNGRKCFAHVETFLNKTQNSYSQCPELKRKKFTLKIIKKNFWTREKPLGSHRCKNFCQKVLIISLKFGKNHKTANCFSIFAFFPNWSFGLIECTFHSSTLDS